MLLCNFDFIYFISYYLWGFSARFHLHKVVEGMQSVHYPVI